MPHITSRDGAQIFYKDWGEGSPVILSHGWPLNADAWDATARFLAEHGYRVITHDRRGHGRSSQTWHGNEMDTYADDLAALIDQLNLSGLTMAGHSTGGGEIVRYVGRHGSDRVAKLVLVSAVPPLMRRTDDNPDGLPVETFDEIRAGEANDRAQLYRDLADGPFFDHNRNHAVSQGIHGDDDQVVPFGVGGKRSAEIINGAVLKVYEGGAHGLPDTARDRLHADLLEFIDS